MTISQVRAAVLCYLGHCWLFWGKARSLRGACIYLYMYLERWLLNLGLKFNFNQSHKDPQFYWPGYWDLAFRRMWWWSPGLQHPESIENGNSFPHDLFLSSATAHLPPDFSSIFPKVEQIPRCAWHCPQFSGTPLHLPRVCLHTWPSCARGWGWWLCPVPLTRPLLHWFRLCGALGFPYFGGSED